jgi:hypothetical protein
MRVEICPATKPVTHSTLANASESIMTKIAPEHFSPNMRSIIRSVKLGMIKIAVIVAVSFAQCIAGASEVWAQDGGVQLTGAFGVDYTNGNYGTDRNTDILLDLSSLSAQIGNLKISASVPYMRISGRGLIVFDAAGNPIVINRKTSIAPDVRSGFGDLNLSATYTIPAAILSEFQVELTGRVKLPTASERRRLSTGEADFGMNVDVSRQMGIWGPFVTIGYLIPGQPSNFSLYNTVFVSMGTTVELDKNLVAVLSYDQDSASARQVGGSREMLGSISWIISNSITLTGYGTAGLSSGSPSVGTGLIVSYGFN